MLHYHYRRQCGAANLRCSESGQSGGAECKCGGHRRSYDPAADQVGASNETGQDYRR